MRKIIFRSAFSLIELLVVIFIIGITYSLVVVKAPKEHKEVSRTLLSLQNDLLSVKQLGTEIEVICKGDKCDKCQAFEDTKELDIKIELFDKKPTTFFFDKFGYLDQKEFKDETCFEYKIYKNRTGASIMVENNQKYYVFYPAIKQTEEFLNFDDAKNAINPAKILPTDKFQYYTKE